MITAEVLAGFEKEAVTGAARRLATSALGKRVSSAAREAPKTLGKGLSESGQILKDLATRPGKTLREGAVGLTNIDPGAQKRMQEAARKGTAKERATRVQQIKKDPAGQRLPKGRAAWQQPTGKYVAETPEQMSSARRMGILSNTPVYKGTDKKKQLINKLQRAAPGQMVLQTPGMAFTAGTELARKEDPKTGRRIGAGERLLGAAGGVASGLATSRHGLIPGLVVGEVGARAGRLAGRGTDVARSRAIGGSQK